MKMKDLYLLDDFVVDVCDVHDEEDVVVEVVGENAAEDVERQVGPGKAVLNENECEKGDFFSVKYAI